MIYDPIRSGISAVSLFLSSLAVSAAQPEIPGGIEHARLLDTLELKGELFHVQGVEVDKDHIWVTSVDRWEDRGYLHEFERTTGKFLRRLELTDGLRYHPGGVSGHGGSLWVPVAELKPDSSAVLVEIDKESLKVRRKIHVADHLGCVAASDSTLIAGNWDSRILYIFDLTNRVPVRAVPNPSQTHYQDMKLVNGQLVAGGSLSLQSGTIDWFDWPTMRLTRTLRSNATIRADVFRPFTAYSAEGMTVEGRDIYVVPEDGPSRMFRFRLNG